MLCFPQEDRELHIKSKEDHRLQISILWDKLGVPQEHREVTHRARTVVVPALRLLPVGSTFVARPCCDVRFCVSVAA